MGERPRGRDAEFFAELAPGRVFDRLAWNGLALRKRPGTEVAASPERPAGMNQEYKKILASVLGQ